MTLVYICFPTKIVVAMVMGMVTLGKKLKFTLVCMSNAPSDIIAVSID